MIDALEQEKGQGGDLAPIRWNMWQLPQKYLLPNSPQNICPWVSMMDALEQEKGQGGDLAPIRWNMWHDCIKCYI